MELHAAVQDIIELVETATGFPVRVAAMPALENDVTVQMARGPVAVHHVLVRPGTESRADYLIARECGRILRRFAVPENERLELAPAPEGRAAVERMLAAPDGVMHRFRLTEEQAASLRDKLYGGLMLQLRMTPVGLRVDDWLGEHFADLRDVREQAIDGEIEEARAMLAPDIRAVTPPGALMAALAMHAAEADYWARVRSDPGLLEPYRSTGSFRDGRALMRLWRETPEDAAHDRALVDGWAEMLGLQGWYVWRPYAAPERDA